MEVNPKKVIIVGSSDSMLAKNLGNKIDEFDVIVRFNRAPTLGFEKYVGSRTTHRYCNTHVSKNDHIKGQDMQFLPSLRNEVIITDNPITEKQFHKVFDRSCSNKVVSRGNEFKTICTKLGEELGIKKYNGHQPSVGLSAICFYINRGFTPTIYGFHIHSNDGKVSPHYWWDKKGVGGYHNFSFERKVIRDLIKIGKIKYLE